MHLPSVISTLAHLDVLPEKNRGELWNDREPLLRSVLNGGSTVLAKDRPFYIEGHGYPETVQFDISYSPVRDEERRVRGVLCIVNDTTDRVKFESALQASEERLRAIFSQSPRGSSRQTSRAAFSRSTTASARSSAIGKASCYRWECWISVLPETSPRRTGSLITMAERGQSFEIGRRLLRKDLTLLWIASSVSSASRQRWRFPVSDRHHLRHYRTQARAGRRASPGRGHRFVQRCHPWHRPWHENHALKHCADRLYGYTGDEVIGRSLLVLVPEDRQGESLHSCANSAPA